MRDDARPHGSPPGDSRLAYPRTLCFIENGGDLLLLKGAPNKRLWPNQYNGVGGHVEPGEDVLTALRREVQEETGLSIEAAVLRAVITAEEPQKPGVVVFVFTATSPTRQVKASAEGTLQWVPQGWLLSLDLVDDLRLLLPRMLALPPGQVLFTHYAYDSKGRVTITFAN